MKHAHFHPTLGYSGRFTTNALINVKETADLINEQYKRGYLTKADALNLIKDLVVEARLYMRDFEHWMYHDGFLKG